MKLIINQQQKVFDPAPSSLAAAVTPELTQRSKGIAVALNNRVVPREKWLETTLQDGDTILIISATQGG